MKSIQGLVVALVLGIVAALMNWAYLANQSRGIELVQYIGVRPGATILQGERLAEEKLEPVPIPTGHIGGLDGFAIRYSDLQTVLTKPVSRTLVGGSLLLEDDLRTPPPELKLKKGSPGSNEEEVALFVPVDAKAFVPSLLQPGDRVSFLVGSGESSGPAPAGPPPTSGAPEDAAPARPTPAAVATSPPEAIGPFVVLALGNRLASEGVARAATVPQGQQNVLTIRARRTGGQLEPEAQRLLAHLRATGFRGMAIMLHPRE